MKSIAISLLGYSTEFIHMTCLGLLAGNNFTQKRLAYLGICTLLDDKSEVLLLTSHTIKKDLMSSNQYIVAAALNAIGEIATPDMCRDSCGEVIKCLNSLSPYIKKKALLALVKIINACPELVDTVANKLKVVFEDKNHGVLLSGLTLAKTVFTQEPSYIKKFVKYIPYMIKCLKSLSTTNYSPEYDINGVTDPFLQTRILEVLAIFAATIKEDSDYSDSLINVLGSLSTVIDTSTKNTGNAVLYELVRTIFSFDSPSSLKVLGSSILGKFLSSKDNNYKYIALDSLYDIARSDINSVQRHKNVILEFLNDNDIALKRKSLDLTYMIVNESNIQQIIKESLNFLTLKANNDFKEELTAKIFHSLEKYSPSLKWEIDIIVKMLCLCENHISDDIICKIINLIINVRELHRYAMFKFYIAMKENMEQEGLIRVGVYLIGELIEMIIGATALIGENENVTVSEEDVVALIIELVERKQTSETVHEELMNCCFKVLSKFNADNAGRIKCVIEKEAKSFYCEVQQRANEYMVFTQIANDEMQRKITEKIPLNLNVDEPTMNKKKIIVDEFENEEEKEYYKNLITDKEITSINKKAINDNTKNSNINTTNNNNVFDLLDGNNTTNVNTTSQQQQQTGNVNLIDDIANIFGNTNTSINNVNNNLPQQQQMMPNNDILNLFAQSTTSDSNTNNIPVMNNQPQQQGDILSQLGNIYSSPQQEQSNPLTQQGIMKEVYKNNDILIYSCLNESNGIYNGSFYISNNTSNELTNVKLHFLVKKNIIFKVISSSGGTLEANASLGIKKEVSIQNTDPSKPIVIKLNISYTLNNQNINESVIINSI